MTDLSSTVSASLAARFQDIAVCLHKWADPLSNDQFWRNPFSFGNSVGHLVLHLTGNLNYYVGAQIAGTGYVRDRDREFSEAARPAKDAVLQAFDRAIQLVADTVRKQSSQDWSAEYHADRTAAKNRFTITLHCLAHADHHVGQIIYLSRELTAQASRTATP